MAQSDNEFAFFVGEQLTELRKVIENLERRIGRLEDKIPMEPWEKVSTISRLLDNAGGLSDITRSALRDARNAAIRELEKL